MSSFLSAYTEPIGTALMFFPFVAMLFTLPYCLIQYRRVGAMLIRRILIVYSFILYLMCAYLLTILPLPDPKAVAGYTTAYIQLIPFRELVANFGLSHFSLTNPSTWIAFLTTRLFLQTIANIVMLIPFGIYLRYYFHCSFKKTMLLSFLLSLLFELTQLSGLFFIYPRPYRLADVDDLITNTLGGVIGYWITKPLLKILPTQEELDDAAYRKSVHVTVFRRLVAMGLDMLLIVPTAQVLGVCMGINDAGLGAVFMPLLLMGTDGLPELLFVFILSFSLCQVVLPTLTGGRTFGHWVVRIKLTREDGSPAAAWQYLVRYGLLYLVVIPMPIYLIMFFRWLSGLPALAGVSNLMTILAVVSGLCCALGYGVRLLLCAITKNTTFLYGRLSRTVYVSTAKRHAPALKEAESAKV